MKLRLQRLTTAAWFVAALATPPTDGALPNATLEVLRELWEQTGGAGWSRCLWTPGDDPCAPPWGQPHWSAPTEDDDLPWGGTVGFVCDPSGTNDGTTNLRAIDLSANNLTGMIPEVIGRLSTLWHLDLNSNQLTGTIPESIGNLTALRFLAIAENGLTGVIPPSIGNLTALAELGLFVNRLNGTIPESFGNLTALEQLGMYQNLLSGAIPESLGRLTMLMYVSISDNLLSGTLPQTIGNMTSLTYLELGNNQLSGIIPDSIGSLTALTGLGLANNSLMGPIPETLGNLIRLTGLDLDSNQLSGGIPQSIGFVTGLSFLGLGNNHLTGTIPWTFANLDQLSEVHLENNHLSEALLGSLPLLTGFQGSLSVRLAGNNISRVGSIFTTCTNRNGHLKLDLSNNFIDDDFLEVSLGSARSCASSLTVDLNHNNVSTVRFSNLVNYTRRYCDVNPCPHSLPVDISVDVSSNPVNYFLVSAENVNAPIQLFSASTTGEISVDLSNTSGSLRFDSSTRFDFSGILWNRATGGSLNLSLAMNPTVPLSVVRALSVAPNPPAHLNLNLSWNNYSNLPPRVFNESLATSIDLSHNAITWIADDAFGYTVALRNLDLSWNQLSVISIPFLNRLPAIALGFVVSHNALIALPMTNNHIANTDNSSFNALRCASYGPTASGCTCPAGYFVNMFSGYVRCTTTLTGCPPGLLWNAIDGSKAPWSSCVNGSVPGQYFFNNTFHPITNCSTYLVSTGKQAYEVQAPRRNEQGTAVSDRLCSLCSTCPSGYHATSCTATSDTKCTQLLSPAAIAAVVLSIALLLIIGMLGAGYGRTQKKQRYQTQTELELTERLLGDVQGEKERAIEEIADMEQAWAIAESDLAFGGVIGEGAYGRVFSGTWGHIPVAIKVLRQALHEASPSEGTDFDREVKFMRSIRHPHLLIFYGAGVDSSSRAFLVTELMTGSLTTVLHNRETILSWEARLTFATDIASGMAYLHDRGTVHRDLKADNCFLSDNNRVKVADFGTGRIAKHIHEGSNSSTNETDLSARALADRTLSVGVGSLLWMSPESLQGSRIRDDQGPSLDVYSYAIVLWEIWSRVLPWNEVKETGVRFVQRLRDLVDAGVRPQLPESCESAPDGYQALMERCWAGRPDHRPNFPTILESLALIPKPTLKNIE